MRVLGLDPGLRTTGWGVIEAFGSRLVHIANGEIRPDAKAHIAVRLAQLHDGLAEVVATHMPDSAAVEEVFLNRNPGTTLKLGLARGVALLVPANAGLPVTEYATRSVKKSLVGTGAAEKSQVEHMVRLLLPGCVPEGSDAADALAVAITDAHHAGRAGVPA